MNETQHGKLFSSSRTLNQQHRTFNTEFRTSNTEHRTCNTEHRTCKPVEPVPVWSCPHLVMSLCPMVPRLMSGLWASWWWRWQMESHHISVRHPLTPWRGWEMTQRQVWRTHRGLGTQTDTHGLKVCFKIWLAWLYCTTSTTDGAVTHFLRGQTIINPTGNVQTESVPIKMYWCCLILNDVNYPKTFRFYREQQ